MTEKKLTSQSRRYPAAAMISSRHAQAAARSSPHGTWARSSRDGPVAIGAGPPRRSSRTSAHWCANRCSTLSTLSSSGFVVVVRSPSRPAAPREARPVPVLVRLLVDGLVDGSSLLADGLLLSHWATVASDIASR